MTLATAGWGVFLIRWALITVTAFGVSFGVADYITTKAMSGFTTAASNLQSSFNNLDVSVKRLDDALRSEVRLLSTERQSLADQIATKIVEIQRGQTGTDLGESHVD